MAGSHTLGLEPLPLTDRRAALLRALTLDPARALLTQWAGEVDVLWALSPYRVPRKCICEPYARYSRPRPDLDVKLRSIDLAALGCVRLGPAQYLNVAVLVDPGHIQIDWLFHQVRSIYHWRSRPAFRARPRAFPLVAAVAANDFRRAQIVNLWRDLAPAGLGPGRLRMTTYAQLAHLGPGRLWWNERNQTTALWGGAVPASGPSARPELGGCWWGEATTESALETPLGPSTRTPADDAKPRVLPRRVLPPSRNRARLRVVNHLQVSSFERELLDRIGQYPLVTLGQLAVVLGSDEGTVGRGLRHLAERELIVRASDGEAGYILSGLGVGLLAAQAGFGAAEYANLRRWPVREESGQVEYVTAALLAQRGHTRLILEFLVGLRRFGPQVQLHLSVWDHLQCAYEFLSEERMAHLLPRLRALQMRIVPDASGVVEQRGPGRLAASLPFWLEVDCRSRRGQNLTAKLVKYYRAGWGRGTRRALPRLLIVVGGDDEARLQALRRRFLMLDRYYHTRLDVRLTREDLLASRAGSLNPTREVWRTTGSSTFIGAFEAEASAAN